MGIDEIYTAAGRACGRMLSRVAGRERLAGYAARYSSQELGWSLGFAGIELEAAEVLSLACFASTVSFILVLLAGAIAFAAGFLDGPTMALLVLCGGILPLLAFVYVGEHPKRRAAYMRVHSLGDVPEVISYVVMSMKLNPNMERALGFAIKNSRRQLARDMRKMMWDLQIRAYDGIDDALSAFAGRWGGYSEHFKRALFIIKSSTCERDEAMRIISLNRALQVVLEGTKSLMSGFSAALHAPTLILYSIFVMVPLALVAMLPAAAIVGIRANAVQLFLLYDAVFPLATLIYAHSILMRRPAAFAPPDLPGDHPLALARPKRAWAGFSLAAGTGTALMAFLLPEGVIPLPSTIFVVWGMAAAISIYCYGAYTPYKRVRDDIVAMEEEFADSLFVLGRRMSEGRSPEEGFAYTARMVAGTAIGRAYALASYNIQCLRTSLRDAVLDPEYGAFSDVYSDRIRATINMLVEASGKSGEVAGSSIIKLADHLTELQDIEREVQKMLFTMTSMLKATCVIFAPFIGGVTLALAGAVSGIVSRMAADLQSMPASARPYFPMVPQFTAPAVSQADFTLIVGVYVILLVIILLRFVDGIEHGDDVRELMYGIGRTLPVSVAVFSVTTALAGALFGGMMI